MRKIQLCLHELVLLTRLLLARLVSLFYAKEELWLISERGKEARDNGYFLFVWLKKNHPEINVKYVIGKKSEDLYKFEDWKKDLVYHDTFSHLLTVWRSSHLISTHILGYIPKSFLLDFYDRKINLFRGKKRVFLQHGIIKDNLPQLYHNFVNLDLFICGAKKEYDYIAETFGYPAGILNYTGLSRYDSLSHFSVKKQVLIMPTWRFYIKKGGLGESEFFARYSSLLKSKRLYEILGRYGYEAIFYPHHELQAEIDLFKGLPLPNCIKIADFKYDVQTLLKESNCLITDYSSVFFDMAYMKKPCLFYQFDVHQYRNKHYRKGYFDYSDLGHVATEEDDLLDELEHLLQHQCQMDAPYLQYCNETFLYHDEGNCERIFQAISQL